MTTQSQLGLALSYFSRDAGFLYGDDMAEGPHAARCW